jgi:hypothetical protein
MNNTTKAILGIAMLTLTVFAVTGEATALKVETSGGVVIGHAGGCRNGESPISCSVRLTTQYCRDMGIC